MSAPRAVLRDIAARGLDPARPHVRIGSDGHLAGPAAETVLPVQIVIENTPELEQVDEKLLVEDVIELEQTTLTTKKGRSKKSVAE